MINEIEKAKESYIAGRKAWMNGDPETALNLTSEAVKSVPDNAGWRATLGQIMAETGRPEEAIEELRRASECSPGEPKFQVLLARSLAALGKTEEAAGALGRALELDPEYIPAWAALGKLEMEAEDYMSAKSTFERLLSLDPENLAAHTMLAEVAKSEGDVAAESSHLGAIADIRSDHVPSQVHHALRLLQSGNFSEAKERYRIVERIQPEHPAARAIVEELERWEDKGGATEEVVSVEYYDAIYAGDNHYNTDGALLDHAKHFVLICDLLEDHGATSVLDIGCGPGQFGQYLRSRLDIQYYGVDYSGVAIEAARNRDVRDAKFTVLDIETNEMPNFPLSTSIVCTEVLEHIRDDLAIVSKIPAGHQCYFSVPSFFTFGHIRHFADKEAVHRRYAAYFDGLEIEEISLGSGKNRLYVFHGKRNSLTKHSQE